MVPHVTDAEKRTRRDRIKTKRRRCGKKRRPLPRAKVGADGPFKEFKIVAFYDDAATHRLVSVTRGDCTQAGKLMRRDAGRRGLDGADDKVGVVDGSDWIKNQVRRQSLPLDALGLDFYHLAENVHKARRAVYGEEDPKDEKAPGMAWAGRLLHIAKHEGYEKLRDGILQWKGGLADRLRFQHDTGGARLGAQDDVGAPLRRGAARAAPNAKEQQRERAPFCHGGSLQGGPLDARPAR